MTWLLTLAEAMAAFYAGKQWAIAARVAPEQGGLAWLTAAPIFLLEGTLALLSINVLAQMPWPIRWLRIRSLGNRQISRPCQQAVYRGA